MGSLPIPAEMFFRDFAFDVLEYEIISNGNFVGKYRGLSNSDENGKYICFLVSDKPNISVGCVIRTPDGLESFHVTQISYDRYNGQPQLLKAYY